MMDKAKQYSRIKLRLSLVGLLFTLAFLIALFVTGLSSLFVRWSTQIAGNNLFLQIPIYLLLLGVTEYIVDLPLHYYSSFYLEHKYQLSNQTLPAWLWRDFKQGILGFVMGSFLLGILYALLRYQSHSWWIIAAILWTFFSLFMARILPTWIIPLFYKVKLISNEQLGERLLALCEKAKLPVQAVYELGLSRDTKKANAALVGWGRSRRVLLGDTLLTHFKPQETAVVLAHELGHHHYHHIWKLVGVSTLAGLIGFFLVDKGLAWFVENSILGSYDDLSGFPLIGLLLTLLSLLLMPIQNAYSRRLERQSDRFAIQLTQDSTSFISAMEKLAEQNLADKNPHPLVEFLFYDHPAIAKRIEMAKHSITN